MKPNQSSARDGSSAEAEPTQTVDAPGQASKRGDQAAEVPPLPPAPLPPSSPCSSQPTMASPAAPPVPPPPTTAVPVGGAPVTPAPSGPVGTPQPVPSAANSRKGWRAALIVINVVAMVITAIAVTLLLTNQNGDTVQTGQSLIESPTTTRSDSTSPGASATSSVTSPPATSAITEAPTTAAPATSPPTQAQNTTAAPATAAPTPAPTEPPPPALPSAYEARSMAQSAIEGLLSADSSNDVEGALGYLITPVDTWVEGDSKSLEAVRENLNDGKSDNTQLSIVGDVTLNSGPSASDLGPWEATVTYELRATGSYYSSKFEETRCIDNLQGMEDRIVGTEDGGAMIKSHRRTAKISNVCDYG